MRHPPLVNRVLEQVKRLRDAEAQTQQMRHDLANVVNLELSEGQSMQDMRAICHALVEVVR